MDSFPNRVPYDLSSGLKQSYEPQNLPDLINDLRQNECGDEFKLFVLNSYLRKCQSELLVADVLEQEHSQCRSMTLKGIDMLKKEIARINKGIGLKVPARLPMDFLAPNEQGLHMNNLDVSDKQSKINLIHHHGKGQEAKLSTNQTPSFFNNPPPRARKDPTNRNRRLKERTMIDFSMNPITKPIWKNKRRAWTEELHARFLTVLHVLGGPEVATPKRIRDHMQVDELTVDQVKSHLQKYRIMWRSNHPELVRKPRKSKFHLDETFETNGASSSMAEGNLV